MIRIDNSLFMKIQENHLVVAKNIILVNLNIIETINVTF